MVMNFKLKFDIKCNHTVRNIPVIFHKLFQFSVYLNNNFELKLKRKNMLKNDSKNTLLKIEKEIEKLI